MKKILFIEDDLSLASAYRAKLSNMFSTLGAVTGDEGLKTTLEWHPDFIILDLFLPGEKSGRQVLQELKNNEQTKNIPVLVLTNLEGQCGKVIMDGAIDCRIKTEVTMQEILNKINEYVG